MLNVFDAM